MKDNFSANSDDYALYRPSYPKEIYAYLDSLLFSKENAWDVGTGNGQVALELSRYFEKVYATDISQSLLQHAVKKDNIFYSLQPAEKTDFEVDFFDLCMVGQAIHWFDFEKFYKETYRTAKDNCLMVVMGYGRIKITTELDQLITSFYTEILGPYWDRERKYIDEDYQTISFPFTEITPPEFKNSFTWNFEHLIGYLGTWSAVKHYSREKGKNPIEIIYPALKDKWEGKKIRKVHFPLLLRVGRIRKE